MTTQKMNQWNVNEAIFACPALVEFRLVCEGVKGGRAELVSTQHLYRFVVKIKDALWVLKYWESNGVYGDLPLDAPILPSSMKHMTRLAAVIEEVAMSEDRDVAPSDLPSLPIVETVKQTDAMKIMYVTDAMLRIPALAALKMYCSGSRNGMVSISSDKYYVRFKMAIEDAMWIFEYWRNHGVTSAFPADAPISSVSALAALHMSEFAERTMRGDGKPRAIAYSTPMVSMLESDHIANIARLKDLTEQVSALKTMLAGMSLVCDANEDIIASQESELIRLNALVGVPKKRKAKVSDAEKLALLWLSLPKQAESLWGISVSKGSKGMIAHTDWHDHWFATLAHAKGFIKAWSIEGERPSLSNLRIGMKPMAGDNDD